MRRWANAFALACLVVLAVSAPAAAGPVILGGDDLTSHGQQDGAGNNQQGWLYMEKAIGNMKPNVTRPNDNSIAALGSASAPVTNGSDAGASIQSAAQANGMTVQFFNDATAINTAFAGISDGSYQPAIVWVAGDDGSNDLGDTGCEGAGTEGEAITNNAPTLDIFVSEGGGLMSHGVCYTWLTALLPSVSTVDGGSSDDLFLTPEGQAAFPGLTDADINAGPWHNHFEGDFGGLQVLARSSDIDDAAGADAAVILGGAAVGLLTPPTPPTPPPDPTYAEGFCANLILGSGSKDNLKGTDGSDLIKGRGGNDKLDGGAGDDCVRGASGRDKVRGGDGNDRLNGGPGHDRISGGSGDDLIKVRAGRSDIVHCGPGKDTVIARGQDFIAKDCEKIKD